MLALCILAAALVAGAAVGLQPRNTKLSGVARALPSSVLVPPRTTVADLRGRPALVNFWASWCDPCRGEAPALERLAEGLHGRARLIGIDWNDTASGARDFVKRYRWNFPNLIDSDGTAGIAYGVNGLPTTFVLDSRAHVVSVLRGPQSARSLRLALARAPSTR